MLVQQRAFPTWHDSCGYWYRRASDLKPFDSADLIVAGTVERVAWTNPVAGTIAFARAINTGKATFRLSADLRILAAYGDSGGRLQVKHALIEVTGLSNGLHSSALAPGSSYLLILQRCWGGARLVPREEEGPPTIPIAAPTADPASDGTPIGLAISALIASAQAGDAQISRYAVPVLGHLAQSYQRDDARAELLALAEGDDEVMAAEAIRALTIFGDIAEGVRELLDRRWQDDNPTISAAALAARVAEGAAATLPDVVAWLERTDLTTNEVAVVAGALRSMKPEEMPTRWLSQYDRLLSAETPLTVRRAAVAHLAAIGTMDVAPLLVKALDDPDSGSSTPDAVVYTAIRGLWEASDGAAYGLHDYCPAYDAPPASVQHCVNLWKQWWKTAQHKWPPDPAPGPPMMTPTPGPPPA